MELFLTALRVTIEIVAVLWGALVFIRVLDECHKTEVLSSWLKNFHRDKDFQIFLLSRGWVTVLEGVSGFGSPPALVAPILLRMGVSQELAILLPLYGNALAVPFGAMSTPLILGFPGFSFVPLARASASASMILSAVTFAGVWILLKGFRLPQSISEWTWLVRGWMGGVLGMFIGAMWFPEWSAAISGSLALLFWIPWSRAEDIFDRKILFLVEMTSALILGQWLFRGVNIFGFRLSNPGLWVVLGSAVIAIRSKKIKTIPRILTIVLPKLQKPFFITFSMTIFIFYITDWMQTHVAFTSINSLQSLWLGFIAPAISGTATLGNLWVSSAFLSKPQLTQAAWVSIGSGFGTLISLQILTSVSTTVGLKKLSWKIWRKHILVGGLSVCVASLLVYAIELTKRIS